MQLLLICIMPSGWCLLVWRSIGIESRRPGGCWSVALRGLRSTSGWSLWPLQPLLAQPTTIFDARRPWTCLVDVKPISGICSVSEWEESLYNNIECLGDGFTEVYSIRVFWNVWQNLLPAHSPSSIAPPLPTFSSFSFLQNVVLNNCNHNALCRNPSGYE